MTATQGGSVRRGWLTTLNPVAKLAAVFPLFVAAASTRGILLPALMVAGSALAILAGLRVRLRPYLATIVVAIAAGSWTTFIFAVLARSDLAAASPLVIAWPFEIRAEPLAVGAATTLRLASLATLGLLSSLGSSSDGLATALVRHLHLPYRLALGPAAAARFVPSYRQDLLILRAAQRARGLPDARGPLGSVRSLARLGLPLLSGGIRRAECLALAMDARGFGAFPERRSRQPSVIRARDLVFAVACWSIATVIILGRAP
jgi:energy-coupling factor transport system permease protein